MADAANAALASSALASLRCVATQVEGLEQQFAAQAELVAAAVGSGAVKPAVLGVGRIAITKAEAVDEPVEEARAALELDAAVAVAEDATLLSEPEKKEGDERPASPRKSRASVRLPPSECPSHPDQRGDPLLGEAVSPDGANAPPADFQTVGKIFEQYDAQVGQHGEYPRSMISPSGMFRLACDVFIALFIFYVLVTEPLSMGFWDPRMLRGSTAIGTVNRVMDVVFVVDLGLNFRTGYFTVDGVLVMAPGAAALNYLVSWFPPAWTSNLHPDFNGRVCDLCDTSASVVLRELAESTRFVQKSAASTSIRQRVPKFGPRRFPLDFISSMPPVLEVFLAIASASAGGMSSLSSAKVFKLIKVIKVFKALRIGKFLKLLNNGETDAAMALEEFMTSSLGVTAGKVLSIICSSFLIAHLLACFMAISGDGWLRTYDPRAYDDDPASHWSWRRRYLAAMYWAFTTMTTVGYGDITPAGDMERIYAIFAMLMGVSFYSYIIASVSSMVSSIDSKNAIELERMEQLAAWMDHYEIQPSLQRRVRRFFKQFYCEHSAIDDAYILEKLAPNLQEAISRYLLHDFILEHALFANLPEGALWKVMLIVRSMKYDGDACIVQKGEPNVALFIFKEGDAYLEGECCDGPDADIELEPGDSFGEPCLLGVEDNSDVTVTTRSKSEFFYMRRDVFLDSFHNLPEIMDIMTRKRHLYDNAAVHTRGRDGSIARRSTHEGARPTEPPPPAKVLANQKTSARAMAHPAAAPPKG
ncbi:voltage-gated potassium channel [Aureococcus anophagefferens]|nr:voltage-gated potassium channel [Aureococcus anophagefferens]